MPVYIMHKDVWLKLKEVYTIQTSSRRRTRSVRVAPYGMVAEAVRDLKLSGFRYKEQLEVPSSKVSRFAARAHMAIADSVIVLIKPKDDDYVAEIRAKTKRELEEAKKVLSKLLEELRTRKTEELVIEEEEESEE
ncbi:MAG: hypothetical protein ABWW69_01390 [Pyrodictiaceae archaeon]